MVDNPSDPQNIVIWEVKTGKKKRTFTKLANEEWPVIKYAVMLEEVTGDYMYVGGAMMGSTLPGRGRTS